MWAGQTGLGLAARQYMDAGEYVPDEIPDAMIADRLAARDCAGGLVLDGYPRTLTQVKQLDTLLNEHRVGLDAVLLLAVDTEELTRRLLQRAGQGSRTDDTEPVIARRLQVYREPTTPLALEYDALGLLAEVKATGPVDHVTDRLLTALDRIRRRRAKTVDAPRTSPNRGWTARPPITATT